LVISKLDGIHDSKLAVAVEEGSNMIVLILSLLLVVVVVVGGLVPMELQLVL
jgi:hypothetical protein